jgi:hypothetical protein
MAIRKVYFSKETCSKQSFTHITSTLPEYAFYVLSHVFKGDSSGNLVPPLAACTAAATSR